jgi:hypothetical protein
VAFFGNLQAAKEGRTRHDHDEDKITLHAALRVV